MWEIVKESVALAMHMCSGPTSSAENADNNNNVKGYPDIDPPMSACVVGKASELLYWLFRADEHSVGRGRVIQSRVLLEILREEVGGDDAPYWLATPAIVAQAEAAYHHGAKPVRRMHPQITAFRPVDGFDFIVDVSSDGSPELAAIKQFADKHQQKNKDGSPLAAAKNIVFFPDLTPTVRTYMFQLIAIADKKTGLPYGLKTPKEALPYPLKMRTNPTPFSVGHDRASGRTLLEEYFTARWKSLAAGTQLVSGAEVEPHAYCAPVVITSPRCAAVRDKHDRTGKDTFVEFISGPENRGRQIPITIEDTWKFTEDLSKTGSLQLRTADLNDGTRLIPAVRHARRSLLKNFEPFASAHAVAAETNAKRQVFVSGDYELYRPYLDPTSPSYRRIICATYTYHKKMDRASILHKTSSHLCDKHLIFTDKAVEEKILGQLDQDRFAVVALNTPGGEDYRNMWQKTRMILETMELVVTGFEERSPEEGANDPGKPTRAGSDPGPKSPQRSSESLDEQLKDIDDKESALAIAKSLLPHFSGFDHILLSGDDVCMNVLKLRKYIADVDEVYGAALPTQNLGVASAEKTVDSSPSSMTAQQSFCGGPNNAGSYGFYRSATVPHHYGFSHRNFVSGGTYLMNIQAFKNYMKSSFYTCSPKVRTFAEDVYIARCHSESGVRGRNAATTFGEDLFNSVGIESITGQAQKVSYTWWLQEYRRRAWARSGPITSKDSIEHHFCPEPEMKRWISDSFGVI